MVAVSAVTVFHCTVCSVAHDVFIALASQTHPCLGVFFHSTYHTIEAFRAHFIAVSSLPFPSHLSDIRRERGGSLRME